jgi:drug/metabolite transporter (DMT)-like permease
MKRRAGAPLRHRLLLGVVLLMLAATVWPGYLLGSRIEPYLFGLPFSLVWLTLCIAVVFAALLLTFRADMRARKGAGR